MWHANNEPDLLGYLVFRMESPDGVPVCLQPEPLPRTTFLDPSAVPGKIYYYFIKAVDSSAAANQSQSSAIAEVQAAPSSGGVQ